MEEAYKIGFRCRNCGETGSLDVPKGTKVEDMPCPNCGCKTLELYAMKSKVFDVNDNVSENEDDSRLGY